MSLAKRFMLSILSEIPANYGAGACRSPQGRPGSHMTVLVQSRVLTAISIACISYRGIPGLLAQGLQRLLHWQQPAGVQMTDNPVAHRGETHMTDTATNAHGT